MAKSVTGWGGSTLLQRKRARTVASCRLHPIARSFARSGLMAQWLTGSACCPWLNCTPIRTGHAPQSRPRWRGVLPIAKDGDTVIKERDLFGGEPETTNNRMELMAAIMALAAGAPVRADHHYRQCLCEERFTGWLHGWKQWLANHIKKPVKNVDLWRGWMRHATVTMHPGKGPKAMRAIQKMNVPTNWPAPG